MIPKDFISEWRSHAPWVGDHQVEQDLVICRALIEIFSDAFVAERLAFRGGTALYKLHLTPAARYSEDIDLVQVQPEPIGSTLDAVRGRLDPWLGEPRRTLKDGRVTLVYQFSSEGPPALPMRLKLEINSREHYALEGYVSVPFQVRSRWYTGAASIRSFSLEELLATKLRALYQRKKGRDLFDLWHALTIRTVDAERLVELFREYMRLEGNDVSRAEFEANLSGKQEHPAFRQDIVPLLVPAVEWKPDVALGVVHERLISLLPGKPWRGTPGTRRDHESRRIGDS